MGNNILLAIFVLLAASVALISLAKTTGLGTGLSYLAAGILVGPYGLHLVSDSEITRQVAEFGIIMILFLIGLDLQPTRNLAHAPQDAPSGRYPDHCYHHRHYPTADPDRHPLTCRTDHGHSLGHVLNRHCHADRRLAQYHHHRHQSRQPGGAASAGYRYHSSVGGDSPARHCL